MALLDIKEMKIATSVGGTIGPQIQHTSSGGKLVHVIGAEFAVKEFGKFVGTTGTVGIVVEFQDHIGFSIQLSVFKWVWIIIPKKDVVEWGVLSRGSIPTSQGNDRSSTIAGLLLYGPIGALVGSAIDDAAFAKQAAKPVIGITYQTGESTSSIFIDFQLTSWYYRLNDFLISCLPDKHRE